MNKDKGLKYRGPRKLFQKSLPPMPKHVLCYYCENAYANSWDHILPYSWGGTEYPDNLIPCCIHCNLILGKRLFYGMEEKKYYIKLRLKKSSKTAYRMVEERRTGRVASWFAGLFLLWLKNRKKDTPFEVDMPPNDARNPSVLLAVLGNAQIFGRAPERRVSLLNNKRQNGPIGSDKKV